MRDEGDIVGGLIVEPGLSWPDDGRALAFVDLSGPPRTIESLPPYPLVGIGPGAGRTEELDAIVEAPVTAEALARQVQGNPKAASLAVQLLRATEPLDMQSALFCESVTYGLLQGSQEHAAWLRSRMTDPSLGEAGNLIVRRSGDVLSLTLDRAGALNAIDRSLRDALFEAFELAVVDREIGRIELRATGAAFSIGGDLREFGTTRDPAEAHLIRRRTLPALPLSRCADRLDVHVQGACIGAGLEMAAFARRLTASPKAWFQLPELAMGLIPGAGGCVSVPRRIGRQRTALMILSGRRISAATALAWGLIDAIEDRPPVDQGHADHLGT